MEKEMIDLFYGFDKGKIRENVSPETNNKGPAKVSPMQKILPLLSDPKKMKWLLISIVIFSLTGFFTLFYWTAKAIYLFINYVIN